MKTRLLVLFPLLLLLNFSIAWAESAPIQWFSLDIDDNSFFTDAKIYVKNTKTGKEESFSTEEWSSVRGLIGKPGKYADLIEGPDTMRDFDDSGPEGILKFRNQLKRKIERDGLEAFKGPSWNALADALGNPLTRNRVGFITARGHSRQAIYEGFKYLHEMGYLPGMPDINNIYAVFSPELAPELKGANTSESKAKVMMMQLDRLQKESLANDVMEVTNRENTGKGKFHLWGFSDDDWGNYEKARDVLTKAQAADPKRWSNVKITLFYTGKMHPTEKKQSIIIKTDGTTRSTTKEEATRMHGRCDEAAAKVGTQN